MGRWGVVTCLLPVLVAVAVLHYNDQLSPTAIKATWQAWQGPPRQDAAVEAVKAAAPQQDAQQATAPPDAAAPAAVVAEDAAGDGTCVLSGKVDELSECLQAN